HLEDVAESPGRYQPELGAGAFDDGVGDQRRSVDDRSDVAQADPGTAHEFAEAFECPHGRIARGRQAFVQANRALDGVVEDEVGEGAADVEPDVIAIRGHARGLSVPCTPARSFTRCVPDEGASLAACRVFYTEATPPFLPKIGPRVHAMEPAERPR